MYFIANKATKWESYSQNNEKIAKCDKKYTNLVKNELILLKCCFVCTILKLVKHKGLIVLEEVMKFNQATDYAFRMVLHMSTLPPGEKMTGAELATAQMIPERFLLKIMRMLIKAGIMRSYRGVDGGFALKKSPDEITLWDVICAVEGDAYLQKCLYDPASCNKSCMGHCAVNEARGTIQNALEQQLTSVSFGELASRELELHGMEKTCACAHKA